MAKTRKQKEEEVASITDKLGKAKSVVFADYRGLTMKQMSDIRHQISEQGAEFVVTKNSLLKLALQNSDLRFPISDNPTFEGPIGTVFAYEEEVGPIKSIAKALKDFSIGKVKGGLFEGEFIDASRVNALALLPNKDELRTKIVGSLGAPLYGIVGVLQANLRNLVYALDAIVVSKGGEG